MACITKTPSGSLTSRPLKASQTLTQQLIGSYAYNDLEIQPTERAPVPYAQKGDLLLYTEDQLASSFQREQLVRALHGHYQRTSGDRQILYATPVEFEQTTETLETSTFCLLQPLFPAGGHGCRKIGLLIGNLTVKKFSPFRGANYGSLHFNISPQVQLFLQRLGKKFKITLPPDPREIKVRCELDARGVPTWKTYQVYLKQSSSSCTSNSHQQDETEDNIHTGPNNDDEGCLHFDKRESCDPTFSSSYCNVPRDMEATQGSVQLLDDDNFNCAVLQQESTSGKKKKKTNKCDKHQGEKSVQCSAINAHSEEEKVERNRSEGCAQATLPQELRQANHTENMLHSTYESLIVHHNLENLKPCDSLENDIFWDLKKICIPGHTQVEALIHLGHICPYQKSKFLILFLRELRLLQNVSETVEGDSSFKCSFHGSAVEPNRFESQHHCVPSTIRDSLPTDFPCFTPQFSSNRSAASLKQTDSFGNKNSMGDSTLTYEPSSMVFMPSSPSFLDTDKQAIQRVGSENCIEDKVKPLYDKSTYPNFNTPNGCSGPQRQPVEDVYAARIDYPQSLLTDTLSTFSGQPEQQPGVALKETPIYCPLTKPPSGSTVQHPTCSHQEEKSEPLLPVTLTAAPSFFGDTEYNESRAMALFPNEQPHQFASSLLLPKSVYLKRTVEIDRSDDSISKRIVFPCNLSDSLHPRNVKMQRMLKSLVAHEVATVSRLSLKERRTQKHLLQQKIDATQNDSPRNDQKYCFSSFSSSTSSLSLSKDKDGDEETLDHECSKDIEKSKFRTSSTSTSFKSTSSEEDSGKEKKNDKVTATIDDCGFSIGDFVQIGKLEGRRDILENQTAEITRIADSLTEDGVLYVTVSLRRVDGSRFQGQHNPIREDIPATSLRLVDKCLARVSHNARNALRPPSVNPSLFNFSKYHPNKCVSKSSPFCDLLGTNKLNHYLQNMMQSGSDSLHSSMAFAGHSLVCEPFSLYPPRTAEGVLCFFWDLEATGLRTHLDDITQIGCVCRRFFFPESHKAKDPQGSTDSNGAQHTTGFWETVYGYPDKEFNCYVYTDRVIPEPVVKLTGITNEFLEKHGVSFDQAVVNWAAWVASAREKYKDCPVWFVAHNGNRFDLPLLFQQEICKLGLPPGAFLTSVGAVGIVDTVVLSRRLPWGELGHARRSHKLQTLYFDVFHKDMPNEHDALGDVVGLASLMDQDPFLFAWSNISVGWSLSEYLVWSFGRYSHITLDPDMNMGQDNTQDTYPQASKSVPSDGACIPYNPSLNNDCFPAFADIQRPMACSVSPKHKATDLSQSSTLLTNYPPYRSIPSLPYDCRQLRVASFNAEFPEEEYPSGPMIPLPYTPHVADVDHKVNGSGCGLSCVENITVLPSTAVGDPRHTRMHTHSERKALSSVYPSRQFNVAYGFPLSTSMATFVSGTTHVYSEPILRNDLYHSLHGILGSTESDLLGDVQPDTYSSRSGAPDISCYKVSTGIASPRRPINDSLQHSVQRSHRDPVHENDGSCLSLKNGNSREKFVSSDGLSCHTLVPLRDETVTVGAGVSNASYGMDTLSDDIRLQSSALPYASEEPSHVQTLNTSNFAYTVGGDRIESPWGSVMKQSRGGCQDDSKKCATNCAEKTTLKKKPSIVMPKKGNGNSVPKSSTSRVAWEVPKEKDVNLAAYHTPSFSEPFEATLSSSNNVRNVQTDQPAPQSSRYKKNIYSSNSLNSIVSSLNRNPLHELYSSKSPSYLPHVKEEHPTVSQGTRQTKNGSPWIPRLKPNPRCPLSTSLTSSVVDAPPHHTLLWTLRSPNGQVARSTENPPPPYGKKCLSKHIMKRSAQESLYPLDTPTCRHIQKRGDLQNDLCKASLNMCSISCRFLSNTNDDGSLDTRNNHTLCPHSEYSRATEQRPADPHWENKAINDPGNNRSVDNPRSVLPFNPNLPEPFGSSQQATATECKHKSWSYLDSLPSSHGARDATPSPPSSLTYSSYHCSQQNTRGQTHIKLVTQPSPRESLPDKSGLQRDCRNSTYYNPKATTQHECKNTTPRNIGASSNLLLHNSNALLRQNTYPKRCTVEGSNCVTRQARTGTSPTTFLTLSTASRHLQYQKDSATPAPQRYIPFSSSVKNISMKSMKILKRGSGDSYEGKAQLSSTLAEIIYDNHTPSPQLHTGEGQKLPSPKKSLGSGQPV